MPNNFPTNNQKTILITGATGLIGRALVGQLMTTNNLRLRLQVRNVSQARAQFSPVLDLTKVELLECDFNKLSDRDCHQLTRDCHSIIHLAGLVHNANASYEECHLLNVQATEHLLSAAIANAVHTFMFMSSVAVYGNGPFHMIDESSPHKGQTPYAVSKTVCEQMIQKANQLRRKIILRPALVFGPGDRGNLIKLIQSINRNRYLHIGNGDAQKSLISAADLAIGVALCLNNLSDSTHIFNIANPQPISTRALSEKISLALGRNGHIPSMPEPLIRNLIKTADSLIPRSIRKRLPVTMDQVDKLTTTTTFSISKLIRDTGFQPQHDLSTALNAELVWAKNNGLLN